jgi:tungstate transport system ATP-binding protein
MMAPLLSIRHLRKSYHDRLLLDIDAVTIQPASAYVLTGANGAGKSTFLRILAGLESAEMSEASFDGQAVQMRPYPRLLREAVVYVHQHPVMFSTSVAHNIAYGLVARGVANVDFARRVDEAMVWAGVEHLRECNPNTLSGGEKQRIALARARILEPKLLLLDEPTSNLDGAAREQVIALIPTLTAAGSSVIMACHDRDLIALPGVQRLKLRDGRLQARQRRMHIATTS